MKILIPIDFDHPNEQSIEHVHKLFPKEPVEVHLLHVVDISPAIYYPEAAVYYNEWESHTLLYSDKTLKAVKDKASYPNMTFHTSAVSGNTTDEILNYCKEKSVDMVVMPTHGRKGLPRFFMGSVAEKVVRMSPVPVYTFKIQS